MKKTLLLFLTALFILSCGVKKTQSLLSEGDYDAAIDRAVEGLRSNKNTKGKQDYVYLLEEAFAKAKDRDLRNLDLLSKDGNPRNYEIIYNTYLQLNNRQEKIRPILPLPLLNKGRNAYFPFDNYNTQIISSRNTLSKYLYDNSKALMLTNDKQIFRRVYDDLNYLNQINPNYKDVLKLIDEARFKGTDFISVSLRNETNMVIPSALQNDLLDFSTYGMNDKWTVYHNEKQKGIYYDYGLIMNFRDINISPEQIKEKEFYNEKQIKDGLKTLVDNRGNVVKDSLGNTIKVDNLKTIKIRVYEFNQFKACQITAKVDYVDLKTNQLLESFPISSEFIFENRYATYKGDKRATDVEYYNYFDRRPIPFPTNEQMVYQTGEDLKAKLKSIITQNGFRN
ncbi:hypothetical protein [Flavobacterium muglaense]|uniref:Lipoprotein n=1 Tax=Flavobacterium muglaense TaxID=2764716 RepID=A0A923SFF6_9FLAO|nr:hypothetical protein [Flavobacterium muglaense]MBC5838038.1 hypothetical protein [Flavobacterium muglaense]MBC5844572.1 hypothetical protein [Flavobacterium muglaense]